MAYLVKTDYSRLIAITLLDEILIQAVEAGAGLTADQCLDNATLMAQAQVSAYLNPVFDMTAEFAKVSGDPTQNLNIMRAVIHLALCNLHHTINPHDVPEMRRTACNDLLGREGELAAVREGELDWGLPAYPDNGTGTAPAGRTMISSAKKFISKPFTDPSVIGTPNE